MSGSKHRIRLTVKIIAAAKPAAREYTLWDNLLAHFGVRIQPSGVRSYIAQTRVKGRWKPSSLETFDIYLCNRLMPHFGRLRLATIDHARISAWFDAASADKPGAASRAFEILRAMLGAARQWGEIGEHVPDACANMVRNPRRPVARYLDRQKLERLGAVLHWHQEEHLRPVSAIRLLTLTGARLSEIINLRWDEIGKLDEDGASARLADSKTGPRTVWLGPEAAKLIAELPRASRAARGPETSRRIGRTGSGSEYGRKLDCPAFASTTADTLGPRRESRTVSGSPPSGATRTPPARNHRDLRASER